MTHTTWVTLALHERIGRAAQQPRPEFEAEAGALTHHQQGAQPR